MRATGEKTQACKFTRRQHQPSETRSDYLWTSLSRVQSGKAGLVSEEEEKRMFIHWLVLIIADRASCSPGLLSGSQTGENVIPSLCVFKLRRELVV